MSMIATAAQPVRRGNNPFLNDGAGTVTVTSVDETYANIGDSIHINGTGFANGQAVTIRGVSATATVWTATKVTVTVPSGAFSATLRTNYGLCAVSVNGVSLSNAVFLTDMPADPGSGYLLSQDCTYASWAAAVAASVGFTGAGTHLSMSSPGYGGSGNALRSTLLTSVGELNVEGSYLTPAFTQSGGALVISYRLKLSATWGCSGTGYKWGYLRYTNDNGRCQLNPISTGGHTRLAVNPYSVSVGYQPIAPFLDTLADDAWHEVVWLHRTNANGWTPVGFPAAGTTPAFTTSDRTGRDAAWIDGLKVVDISAATVDITPTGADRVWCKSVDTADPGGGTSSNNLDSICSYDVHSWEIPTLYFDVPADCTEDRDRFRIWRIA